MADTSARQFRLAVFEKRIAVFDATMDLLATVVRNPRMEIQQAFDLLKKTKEHELLFGPEIGAFIDEVYRRSVDLSTKVALREDLRHRDLAKETELVNWFAEQLRSATALFLPYMDFRQS